ncbi:hypothetical protein Q0S69_18915, partial [Escherichia coli :H15]
MASRINVQVRDKQNQFLSINGENLHSLKSRHVQDKHLPEWLKNKVAGFAPIFPDICYHLTHY